MEMQYEIVTLEERKAAGLSARTNNLSPEMGQTIGGLWSRFYQEGVWKDVQGRVNAKALGLYMDYAGTQYDDYTAAVACWVEEGSEQPEGIDTFVVPAGRYAKFIIKGDVSRTVGEFWGQVWNMDLPRAFVCDFEEYQDNEMEQAEIHIYIGLKAEE